MPLVAGGKFDAANQLKPGRLGIGNCGIVPGKRVVIGNRERLEPYAPCLRDQFLRFEGAVRMVGMAVKVDHTGCAADASTSRSSTSTVRSARPSALKCSPHSLTASGDSHHQRPARSSSPASVGRVHGSQPMLV